MKNYKKIKDILNELLNDHHWFQCPESKCVWRTHVQSHTSFAASIPQKVFKRTVTKMSQPNAPLKEFTSAEVNRGNSHVILAHLNLLGYIKWAIQVDVRLALKKIFQFRLAVVSEATWARCGLNSFLSDILPTIGRENINFAQQD